MSEKSHQFCAVANYVILTRYTCRRVGEGGSGWLLSVANIDVAAKILFAQLWLIDLYAKRHLNKAMKVRKIWQGLDGNRGLQYTRSLNMPGGFQSRLFQVWITWDEIVEADGRKTYVIAISPIQEYRGTRHSIETAKWCAPIREECTSSKRSPRTRASGRGCRTST